MNPQIALFVKLKMTSCARAGNRRMEIMYDSRLQPIVADVSGYLHGAPASTYGDACKGAFSKVAMT